MFSKVQHIILREREQTFVSLINDSLKVYTRDYEDSALKCFYGVKFCERKINVD